MNASSTDVLQKRNAVVARLQHLLRFVVITGTAILAIFALYLFTDPLITKSGSSVVFFMLVALTAASVFIAFNFDGWFFGHLLNTGALFSTPTLLGRDLNTWFVAAVIVGSLLSFVAALVHSARRQERWYEQASTPKAQRSDLFLVVVPPEKRRFGITLLSRAERFVIKYPEHASIFELMGAAKKAWTLDDVKRLEVEIAERGAWVLYTRLEGSEYQKTGAGAPDTRNRVTRWAEGQVVKWLESRYRDHARRRQFLASAQAHLPNISLGVLLLSLVMIGTAVAWPELGRPGFPGTLIYGTVLLLIEACIGFWLSRVFKRLYTCLETE